MILDSIKKFFERNIAANTDDSVSNLDHSLQIATAALLVEIMHADFEVSSDENEAIRNALCESFDLTINDAEDLIRLAEQEMDKAADYFQFTSLINKHFDLAQKVKIVENFWKVAFSDGVLDKYEDHIVRKIADLLYVPHREFIAAKHRADTRNTE